MARFEAGSPPCSPQMPISRPGRAPRPLELQGSRGRRHAVRHVVGRADHQLGRDVVGRGEAGADGARHASSVSTRSARAKASASPGSISAPGAEQKTAKFTIGATDEGVHRGRHRGRARLRRGRPARGRRPHPGRLLQGRGEVGRDVPRRSTGSAGRCPATSRASRADGTITLLGRGSVVINSGGEKVFPEEVEEAVKLHPAVADCLVVGVPDERFGEAVTAVVVAAPGRRRRRPTS